MTFQTGVLSACPGGEHLTIPITINGVTRDFHFNRDAILRRMRSAVLEGTTGSPTPLQVRQAVSNKTFEV